jgi:hypothetical protein
MKTRYKQYLIAFGLAVLISLATSTLSVAQDCRSLIVFDSITDFYEGLSDVYLLNPDDGNIQRLTKNAQTFSRFASGLRGVNVMWAATGRGKM